MSQIEMELANRLASFQVKQTQLETSLRRTKTGLTLLATLCLAAMPSALSLWPQLEVRSRRFVLVDANGKQRAELGLIDSLEMDLQKTSPAELLEMGRTRSTFPAPAEVMRERMKQHPLAARLKEVDHENPTSWLVPGLRFIDSSGTTVAFLGLEGREAARFVLYDEYGRNKVDLSVPGAVHLQVLNADESPAFWFAETFGSTYAKMNFADGAAITFGASDEKGERRSSIETQDPSGKLEWSVP